MSTDNPHQQALEEARENFRRKLSNPKRFDEIMTAKTTAVDVHASLSDIQEKLTPKGKLRYVARLKPLVDRLSAYSTVIGVFVSTKPDILALIWGPIRLFLLWSNQLSAAFEKIADMLGSIGRALPNFAVMTETFKKNDVVKAASVLFYEDILYLHLTLFEFFEKTRWQQFFDIIWPKFLNKLDAVRSNFREHALLLRNEVTFLDIKEAKEARDRSYEFITQTETLQGLRKYLGLKSRVSPRLYDEKLDWVRNRCVPGCAAWLLRDEKFCDWLDTAKSTVVWLWLSGIPGAGKTYLTAAAIEHTREKHRTLFVFAAHKDRGNLSALSVVLSLLFQAAEDDKDFQSHLVGSQERELRGNLGHAVDLLKSFLLTAGHTCIVIDGLDEMDEYERRILLRRLDELSKACGDLRLLISSRPEDDISRELQQKAASIRVDHRNSGSIQTYVYERCQSWMASRQFSPATKSEVLDFISPLSAKAKGMFLYARVVLDSLEQSSSIEEIQRELESLPNGLNDAYERIFHRINELRPHLRAKCRKVLGWIGCAPIPLSALEMEQALSIDSTSENGSLGLPQLFANVNFVQMCGPIIEIADERLQFVHFTVYEYIFNREIRNYIDKATATEELTLTFLAYLDLIILDVDLDDEDIHENIVNGKYRLFQYANCYWPTLLQQTKGSEEHSFHIKRLLDELVQKGRNYQFKSVTDQPKTPFKNLDLKKRVSTEAFEMVCETFQFRLDDKRWDWNWSNSDIWINFDPLTTSQLWVRIQEQHEALALDPTHELSLRLHYGTRLLRCTYAFCGHSFRALKIKGERVAHIKNHGQPWKCSIPNCEWSTIGFSSKARRDKHWLKVHLPAPSQLNDGLEDLENLDIAEAQPLFFFSAIEGDVDVVRRILSAQAGRKFKPDAIASARCHAAEAGSLAVTQLLAPPFEKYMPHKIVEYAIQSKDVEFAEWAIPKTQPQDSAIIMKIALGTELEQIYTLWEEHVVNMPRSLPVPNTLQKRDMFTKIFSHNLFRSIRNNDQKESRVMNTLRKLDIDPLLLGFILVCVAKSSCSLVLVKELLALGAPIDYPQNYHCRGATALQMAAKNTSKEAALLMEYLILKGASTYAYNGHQRGESFGQGNGAKDMAKYVGQTWEELEQQYLKTLSNS